MANLLAPPMSDNEALRRIVATLDVFIGRIIKEYTTITGDNEVVIGDVEEPVEVRAASNSAMQTVVTNIGNQGVFLYEKGFIVATLEPNKTWVSPTSGKLKITASLNGNGESEIDFQDDVTELDGLSAPDGPFHGRWTQAEFELDVDYFILHFEPDPSGFWQVTVHTPDGVSVGGGELPPGVPEGEGESSSQLNIPGVGVFEVANLYGDAENDVLQIKLFPAVYETTLAVATYKQP